MATESRMWFCRRIGVQTEDCHTGWNGSNVVVLPFKEYKKMSTLFYLQQNQISADEELTAVCGYRQFSSHGTQTDTSFVERHNPSTVMFPLSEYKKMVEYYYAEKNKMSFDFSYAIDQGMNTQVITLPGPINAAAVDVNDDDCIVISHVPGVQTARRVIDQADTPPRRLRTRPTNPVKRLAYKATKKPTKKTKKNKKTTLPQPTTTATTTTAPPPPTTTTAPTTATPSSLDFSCKIDIDILTQSKLPHASPMPVSPAGLCQLIPKHQMKLVSYSDSESESEFDSFFDEGSCYLDITKEEKNVVDLNVTYVKYKL